MNKTYEAWLGEAKAFLRCSSYLITDAMDAALEIDYYLGFSSLKAAERLIAYLETLHDE